MSEEDKKLIGDFMGRIIVILSRNLPKQDEQLRLDLYALMDIRTEFQKHRPDSGEGGEG